MHWFLKHFPVEYLVTALLTRISTAKDHPTPELAESLLNPLTQFIFRLLEASVKHPGSPSAQRLLHPLNTSIDYFTAVRDRIREGKPKF